MKDDTVGVFFTLLRAGLWENLPVHDSRFMVHGPEQVDWERVYQLATEQSVIGVVLAGIEHSNVKPPQELLLQWIGDVQMLEHQNKAMNQFIAELIEKMRRNDIYTLLIKGQGIAQCYERPFWRAYGDIDLFLSAENYDKAKTFLLPLGEETEPEEAAKRHFAMQVGQWAIELHGTLHSGLSHRIDKVLDEVQNDVFFVGNVRSWMNDRTQVFLPGVNCDVIYVLSHIVQHFYKGGVGLRQICDWCRLLWIYRYDIDLKILKQRLNKMGLMSEWKAFGCLAVDYLGLPTETMPFYDERFRKKGRMIKDFVIKVGNFGHNRDLSYYGKRPYIVRKGITAFNRIKDLSSHSMIFPIDSLRFFVGIMYNGVVSAIRGE